MIDFRIVERCGGYAVEFLNDAGKVRATRPCEEYIWRLWEAYLERSRPGDGPDSDQH